MPFKFEMKLCENVLYARKTIITYFEMIRDTVSYYAQKLLQRSEYASVENMSEYIELTSKFIGTFHGNLATMNFK